jgi:hypothetical protein
MRGEGENHPWCSYFDSQYCSQLVELASFPPTPFFITRTDLFLLLLFLSSDSDALFGLSDFCFWSNLTRSMKFQWKIRLVRKGDLTSYKLPIIWRLYSTIQIYQIRQDRGSCSGWVHSSRSVSFFRICPRGSRGVEIGFLRFLVFQSRDASTAVASGQPLALWEIRNLSSGVKKVLKFTF